MLVIAFFVFFCCLFEGVVPQFEGRGIVSDHPI